MVERKGNLKENNCKLSIKQQTPVQPWSPFNPEMRVLCAHNFSACVTLQELKQTRLKTGGARRRRRRKDRGGMLGEGECQTGAAGAERRQRKWGGSVPCDHFLGHGAWPPPSGANHSIFDNFLKHLNLFPAPQHPNNQVSHISNSFSFVCPSLWLLIDF